MSGIKNVPWQFLRGQLKWRASLAAPPSPSRREDILETTPHRLSGNPHADLQNARALQTQVLNEHIEAETRNAKWVHSRRIFEVVGGPATAIIAIACFATGNPIVAAIFLSIALLAFVIERILLHASSSTLADLREQHICLNLDPEFAQHAHSLEQDLAKLHAYEAPAPPPPTSAS